MSGLEYDRNGVYRLYSELKGHKDGQMSCPSDLVHGVVIENESVCDITVEFRAIPGTDLVTYADGTPWTDSLSLRGSSKPRRQQRDWREEEMRIGPRSDRNKVRLRHDIDVTSEFHWREADGYGPPERGVSVRHRLTLK